MNSFGSQKKPAGPLIVGLTGQTGAGKSTVTEAFAEKGFVVIDCDAPYPRASDPPGSPLNALPGLRPADFKGGRQP